MALKAVKPIYRLPQAAAAARFHIGSYISPPSKGLDVSLPFTAQDPLTAVAMDNFFVRRFGPVLRAGSTRWVSNIPEPVLSLMAYNPPRGTGGSFLPKLFAGSEDENIYDVTDQQNEAFVPVAVATLAGQIEPGVLSWTNFATAGTNYLVVCVAGAGVWTYDDAGGWVDRTASITTVTPGLSINFDFVMAWKNRLWFILNNTTEAFYLPTGSITGAAALFDFGPLLVHGGDLKAMASWTVDGGEGIDDKLVIVGEGGDVLIYQGTDPAAAATFAIVGRWFTGRPPAGRRFLSKYGGDLAMITERGIEYMSRLLQARGEIDPETRRDDSARRYNEVIGNAVRATRGQNFWQFVAVIGEEAMIVVTPNNEPISGYQYCFNLLAQGWSRMLGMAMVCGEEYEGDLFYGTDAGTVIKAFEGNTDDQLSDDTPGRPVIGELQTAFINPGPDAISLKRPLLICPVLISTAPPSLKVQINTDWVTIGVPGSPAYIAVDDALWDVALWDEAVWAGSAGTYHSWIGTEGLGCYFSLRMALQGAPGTTFTGWKLIHEPGGMM